MHDWWRALPKALSWPRRGGADGTAHWAAARLVPWAAWRVRVLGGWSLRAECVREHVQVAEADGLGECGLSGRARLQPSMRQPRQRIGAQAARSHRGVLGRL